LVVSLPRAHVAGGENLEGSSGLRIKSIWANQ
jgi:hypothetical protein